MMRIAQGLLAFRDPDFNTNSYLLIDPESQMAVVDPTFNTATEILKPLLQEMEDEKRMGYIPEKDESLNDIRVILLTSDEIPELDGINLICKHYKDVKIYIQEQGVQDIKNRAKDYEFIKQENIVPFSSRMEVSAFVFNILHTPGLNKTSVCIRFKEAVFTGYTLLTNTVYDLSIPGINRDEWIQSLNNLKMFAPESAMICPVTGPAERLTYVLKHNTDLLEIWQG